MLMMILVLPRLILVALGSACFRSSGTIGLIGMMQFEAYVSSALLSGRTFRTLMIMLLVQDEPQQLC
jgi:hypothetical protein